MAGHSTVINGTRIFVDYADGYGESVVGGRTWRWTFHDYLGPLWLRKDGEALRCQCPTRKAVWAAFTAWHRRYEQAERRRKLVAKQKTARGA